MRPNGVAPSFDVASGLAKSYDLIKYDVALLGRDEAKTLTELGVQPDSTRKTAKTEPFTVITTKNGDKIGFLRFPSLPEGEDIPSRKLMNRITSMIKKERNTVRLLIGLSDWGWVGEQEYLNRGAEFVPDILLGSGLGSGVTGRLEADGRCAWYRTYDKGKTVLEARIFSWPERTKPFVWKDSVNIRSLSIGLGDKYPDNPDVSAILN